VAHIFVLNDWAGIEGDARDPNRAARTFMAKGVRRSEAGCLGIALLVLALILFSRVHAATFVIAIAIAGLSALYSAPGIHGKGTPIFNSALHLAGGTLHFLLGYSAFSAMTGRGVAIACYFGIVFAAGHLTHEARDYDGDLLNHIRTNAVRFGRRPAVLASLVLFTIAYALLTGLALFGFVPVVLAFAGLLYPLHLFASLRAIRSGLDFEGLRRLQDCYRRIHAVIGLAMLVTVPPWW
jgi:4-hydroxybenzoate polyprenyltransferase